MVPELGSLNIYDRVLCIYRGKDTFPHLRGSINHVPKFFFKGGGFRIRGVKVEEKQERGKVGKINAI